MHPGRGKLLFRVTAERQGQRIIWMLVAGAIGLRLAFNALDQPRADWGSAIFFAMLSVLPFPAGWPSTKTVSTSHRSHRADDRDLSLGIRLSGSIGMETCLPLCRMRRCSTRAAATSVWGIGAGTGGAAGPSSEPSGEFAESSRHAHSMNELGSGLPFSRLVPPYRGVRLLYRGRGDVS